MASFLFELYYPEPEKTYQWRIQLDCGCVRDAVTRQLSDDKPADKGRGSENPPDIYRFSLVRPSRSEVRRQTLFATRRRRISPLRQQPNAGAISPNRLQ